MMDAPTAPLALIDWPPAGEALAWQGPLLALALTHAVGSSRDAARAAIRAALCEAAAQLLGVGAERLEVSATPGSAPQLLLDGADAGIGISISHAETLSVAVLHRAGAVGVDLMRIAIGSDWARVAHDYLGMATATRLAAAEAAARPAAFCRAWVRREAILKLRGEQLGEWTAPAGGEAAAHCIELALPDGLVGALAVARGQ